MVTATTALAVTAATAANPAAADTEDTPTAGTAATDTAAAFEQGSCSSSCSHNHICLVTCTPNLVQVLLNG